jgi:excisionase family DNA binding protein
MDSSEKWYSVKEAAHLLSVGVDSVRRWIARKKLQAFRLPGNESRRHRKYECWRIAESELARFMRVNMNF